MSDRKFSPFVITLSALALSLLTVPPSWAQDDATAQTEGKAPPLLPRPSMAPT